MLLNNKYSKYYFNIIDRAKSRNFLTRKAATAILGYVERHHIIPQSIGGSNDIDNLIFLTPREHYVCHLLLTKMVTGNNLFKMVHAFKRMMTKSKNHKLRHLPPSRRYDQLRTLMNAKLKGKVFTKTHRDNLSKARKGKPQPEHIAQRLRTQNLGKPMSVKSKRKLSVSLTGRDITDQHKQNMSLNHADVSGSNNPRARLWEVESPVGELTIINGSMDQFCNNHGLSASTMRSIGHNGNCPKSGKCAGWKVRLLS